MNLNKAFTILKTLNKYKYINNNKYKEVENILNREATTINLIEVATLLDKIESGKRK